MLCSGVVQGKQIATALWIARLTCELQDGHLSASEFSASLGSDRNPLGDMTLR